MTLSVGKAGQVPPVMRKSANSTVTIMENVSMESVFVIRVLAENIVNIDHVKITAITKEHVKTEYANAIPDLEEKIAAKGMLSMESLMVRLSPAMQVGLELHAKKNYVRQIAKIAEPVRMEYVYVRKSGGGLIVR